MAIKKGLGRGLDMLIPREDTSHKAEASVEKKPGQQENAEPKEYDVEIDIRKINR